MSECTFHPKTKDFSKIEKFLSPKDKSGNFEEHSKISSDKKGSTSTKPLGVQRT